MPFLMLALTPPTSLVTQKSALVNDNETRDEIYSSLTTYLSKCVDDEFQRW